MCPNNSHTNANANPNPNANSNGHLLSNLLLFGRLLRGLGLDVNPGRMIDLAQALRYIDLRYRAQFYHAARCLLVHRHEDIPLFDQAFDLFWRHPDNGWMKVELSGPGVLDRTRRPQFTPPPLRAPDATLRQQDMRAGDDGQPPTVEVTFTYSAQEMLRQKDFAEASAEELDAIKRLMAHIVWHLGERRTRRQQPGAGRFLDFRRTVRKNLRYGGEILLWSRRELKFKPRPLILLADISGSMERYSRLLIHFIYSLAVGLEQQVEAFVFGTRLTRITRELKGRDVDRALDDVARAVPDWSGGTRIGEALKRFNFDWARRVLGRGAVVVLISDGWDRGDPELLHREMARLQRSCYRLIWLNPLLGSPDYEPLTRGMQTALPYIDDFLPVHNLASLEDLADHLNRLDDRRRGRTVSV